MDKYIDDKYSIIDSTLITINHEERKLTIPADVNGHRIKRIGAGIYLYNGVETIELSEGIEEISKMFFPVNTGFKKMILPSSLKQVKHSAFVNFFKHSFDEIYLNRVLTQTDYDTIYNNSILLADGKTHLLNPSHRNMECFSSIYNGIGLERIPLYISKEMNSIYISRLNSDIEERPFWGNEIIRKDGLDHFKDFKLILARYLIKNKPKVYHDVKSEIIHDTNLQENRTITHQDVLVLTEFNEDDVHKTEDKINVRFHIVGGTIFFGNIINVVYQGKEYYIYRENYLKSSGGKETVNIQDYLGFVFDSEGRIPDRQTIIGVTSKYKLLSMLN